MHIVIAIITAVAGLIWALNSLQRSGVDLNSFNPYFWLRRRKWEQQTVNPLYSITSPRELAALLAFAALRLEGDPTAEQKTHLLKLYVDSLRYPEANAPEIYTLVSHLLGTDPNYADRIRDIVKPSLDNITDEQKALVIQLINDVSVLDGALNTAQKDFVANVRQALGLIAH